MSDKSIDFQLRNLGTNESVNISLQNEGVIVFDKETKTLFVDGVQFGFCARTFNTFNELNNVKVSFSYNNDRYVTYSIDSQGIIEHSEITIGEPDIMFEDAIFVVDVNVIITRGNVIYSTNSSNFVTYDEFSPVSTNALNSIQKGTLGTINGVSLENNDVTLDLSLYKIVKTLPTEDIQNNKIYLVESTSTTSKNVFDEYIYNDTATPPEWELIGQVASEIDLSGYLTKDDADKKYVKKSENTNSSITTGNTGSMSNFGDNGQAYLAVRQRGSKFLINAPYAGASFGVKDDGTTAFSHKTYQTFNKDTGAYTGAKNTAVLQFAGPTGLRYAKNTGSGNDVTEDMYKYVGVIDSADEFQRVYSAKQVDDLLKNLTDRLILVESMLNALTNNSNNEETGNEETEQNPDTIEP